MAEPAPGAPIEETGRLVRVGGGFALIRDVGGRFLLDLNRTPVDEVEKRVRVVGSYAGGGIVEVAGVALI